MKYAFIAGILGLLLVIPSHHNAQSEGAAKSPSMVRDKQTKLTLKWPVGDYIENVRTNWLLRVMSANPAILQMFRDRDRQPLRNLEPWAGEFAGKYLTGAVQFLRLNSADEGTSGSSAFAKLLRDQFVPELLWMQDTDGYLGPFPKSSRLTGHAPNVGKSGGPTWDAWGHYHIMLGLLLWHQDTGDQKALQGARRIGDLLCEKFLGDKKPRLVDIGSTEMNLAPIDSLCLLYQATKEPRYLALAKQILEEFAAHDSAGKPLAGDYLHAALAGKEFFQSPKPRWESLHPILGLVRLCYITGDDRYRRAFEHWWWSIVKLDRHNNGGFTSGEQAQGNPYHRGPIETCCTIAWLAMSVEMLQLTGNSIVADELELTTLNSALGLFSPSGRWCTYNTPMDGVRKASFHDIVFQSREGSPELNCCSVNAARGLGLISEWALLRDREGLVLNWYGREEMSTVLPSGNRIQIVQATDYPRSGRVTLRISPQRAEAFTLKLRIPHWSERTTLTINGQPAPPPVKAGTYYAIQRRWQPGDVIVLELDFSLHFWVGERECQGLVSIYRGPILLTYDRHYNTMDPAEVPTLNGNGLQGGTFRDDIKWMPPWHIPWFALDFPVPGGKTLRLCDFASAGNGGSPYRSWLPVRDVVPAEFSRTNPLRSSRVVSRK